MRLVWKLIPWLALTAGCGSDGKADDSSGSNAGAPTGIGSGTGLAVTGTGTGLATGTGTGASSTSIEVGNGVQSHVAATPGQVVRMNHGPQNGWHIDVSGEVRGLGDVVGLRVWATRVDTGAEVASSGNQTFLQLAGYDAVDQTGWFAGQRNFLTAPNGFDDICPLDGLALNLCAEAEDLAAPGTLADGCVEVTVEIDPVDSVDCAGGTTATATGTGTGTGAGTGSPTP